MTEGWQVSEGWKKWCHIRGRKGRVKSKGLIQPEPWKVPITSAALIGSEWTNDADLERLFSIWQEFKSEANILQSVFILSELFSIFGFLAERDRIGQMESCMCCCRRGPPQLADPPYLHVMKPAALWSHVYVIMDAPPWLADPPGW